MFDNIFFFMSLEYQLKDSKSELEFYDASGSLNSKVKMILWESLLDGSLGQKFKWIAFLEVIYGFATKKIALFRLISTTLNIPQFQINDKNSRHGD